MQNKKESKISTLSLELEWHQEIKKYIPGMAYMDVARHISSVAGLGSVVYLAKNQIPLFMKTAEKIGVLITLV